MRIAVITGASSGLGREYVRAIAARERGLDQLWVIARRADRLEALQALTTVPVRAIPADLTEPEAIDRIAALYAEVRPEIALLINAAGFGRIGGYAAVSRRDCGRMIDLNCRAAVEMTVISLPYMRRGSRIMEICSTSAFQPFQYLNVYAASKAFLYRYARALRIELLGRGIRVTAVCPYWIRDTEFIANARKTQSGGREIRHFPLASRAASVARLSLADSRLGLPVSTPGLVCALHRLAAKFIPHELLLGLWGVLRRL